MGKRLEESSSIFEKSISFPVASKSREYNFGGSYKKADCIRSSFIYKVKVVEEAALNTKFIGSWRKAHDCLSPVCCNGMPSTEYLRNKGNLLLTVLEPVSSKPKGQNGLVRVRAFIWVVDCWLFCCIFTWQRAVRGSKFSCDSYKSTNPICIRASFSWSNCILIAFHRSHHLIPLHGGQGCISTHEFWRWIKHSAHNKYTLQHLTFWFWKVL